MQTGPIQVIMENDDRKYKLLDAEELDEEEPKLEEEDEDEEKEEDEDLAV